jgi:hypothetical protein
MGARNSHSQAGNVRAAKLFGHGRLRQSRTTALGQLRARSRTVQAKRKDRIERISGRPVPVDYPFDQGARCVE